MSYSLPTKISFIAFILGTAFYFYETVLEVAPSTIVSQLMASFHLSGAQVGILDTCYFITYAVLQMPGGRLLDRYGAKRLLILATLACGLGNLLLAATPYFPIAVISRLLTGLGGSFGLLGALFIVTRYFPAQYLARFMGLAIMIGLSGGLLQSPLAVLVQNYGWRMIVSGLGLVALLLSTLILFSPLRVRLLLPVCFSCDLTKKSINTQLPSRGLATGSRFKNSSFKNFFLSCRQLLRKPQNWLIALYGGLMYIPTGTIGSLWGTELLQAHYPLESKAALASVNAMIFLGWIVGSPLVGWVSDKLQRRKLLLVMGSVGLLVMLGIMVYLPLPRLVLFIIFFMIGIFSACSGITFAMISEINAASDSGLAIGFTNTLAIIPSILASPLFGWVLDKMSRNTLHFSWSAFQAAMWVEYVVILVALVLALVGIRETYSVSLVIPQNA